MVRSNKWYQMDAGTNYCADVAEFIFMLRYGYMANGVQALRVWCCNLNARIAVLSSGRPNCVILMRERTIARVFLSLFSCFAMDIWRTVFRRCDCGAVI